MLAAMIREPSLLRTPILVADGMVLVGFEGEELACLLDEERP